MQTLLLLQNESTTYVITAEDLFILISTPRQCSERFYEEQGLCRPECGSWKALPDSTLVVLDVLGQFLSAGNLLIGIVTIILAVIQRHKLYVVKINRRWLPFYGLTYLCTRCSI